MPDADLNHAAKALVGAAFGAAGQRCMAISAIVVVGNPVRFEHALCEAAAQLKVSSSLTQLRVTSTIARVLTTERTHVPFKQTFCVFKYATSIQAAHGQLLMGKYTNNPVHCCK
eukprot:jgi/Ulvmu1/7236/UM035_0023.1